MAAAGLEVLDVENLRRPYALTLEHWAGRFDAAKDKVPSLAGQQRYRIWRIYLAGCAYGFRQDWIALHQILTTKSGGPDFNKLPLTRDYMYRPR